MKANFSQILHQSIAPTNNTPLVTLPNSEKLSKISLLKRKIQAIYKSRSNDIKNAVLNTTGKGENQSKAYTDNDQRNNSKNNLTTHFLSLSGKPINNNQHNTSGQTGNREESNPIIFNHTLTPLVKNIPALREPMAREIPQIRETVNSSQLFGRETKGLTTPATNQPTPILERNSATNLRWPTESFPINDNVTTWQRIMSIEYDNA